MRKRVFLGGTCNESKWRELLISILEIDFFNPVVDDWDDEARENELKARQECDYLLYVITPKMTGVYAVAEVVDDSNKQPSRTIFVVLNQDEDKIFTKGQIRSLYAVKKMILSNGGKVFDNLEICAKFLNSV